MEAISEEEVTEIELYPNAVAPKFWPYLRNRSRFLLLWGGRDSTKSDFAALLFLLAAIELPYFKCVLTRRYANTVGGSQVATLEKVAKRWGIYHLFKWGVSPLGVWCKENGNGFVPFGTDDMDKLKSLSDPTHVWYEEANQIAQADADVISTSLRSSVPGSVLQEVFTFNPDHEGDYKTFWLWQKFFEGTGHPDGTTFSGSLDVEVDGKQVRQSFDVLHSTAQDNPWCPPERKATYKGYEHTDPYRFRVWWEGLWATKKTGNEWYPMFSRANHVKPTDYLPGVNIFQSWDANSLPYSAMFCAQTQDQRSQGGKLTLRIFKEYAIRSPNSGIRSTGRQFLLDRQRLGWQSSAVFCTGDASLKARKVGEERETNFNDVVAALNGFTDDNGNRVPGCLNGSSMDFWPRRNPEVMRRRDFVNYLLAGGLHDVDLQIDPGCIELIADCELTQLGIDGKLKEMYQDKALGVRYQLRGHMSDNLEYLCCTILAGQYEAFKDGR